MHHFFILALLSVQDLIFARRSRKSFFVSSSGRALKNLVVDLRFLGFRRLLSSILLVFGATVSAQDAIFEQMFEFDIPQQSVGTALIEFAEQADLTLVFPEKVVREKSGNAFYTVVKNHPR